VPTGCGLSAGLYVAPRQQLARRIARWTARCTRRLARRRMLRDGPGGLPDGSLMYRFGGGFKASPASCATARSRRFGGWLEVGPASCPTARSHRSGLADRSTQSVLATRLARQRRRWAWAQAQSYSSWSVQTISRLMPAPHISLNEVITGPSEVEGLSGSTARPFYLSA